MIKLILEPNTRGCEIVLDIPTEEWKYFSKKEQSEIVQDYVDAQNESEPPYWELKHISIE